jgi:hypothetical protein
MYQHVLRSGEGSFSYIISGGEHHEGVCERSLGETGRQKTRREKYWSSITWWELAGIP